MMANNADRFNKDTRDRLAARVCLKCSVCGCPTAGPADDSYDRVMLGEAAHICAAAPGGARYDPGQSSEQRRSIANGIWVCAKCVKRIDDDAGRFTVAELKRIKDEAESRARRELELPPRAADQEDWHSLQMSRIALYTAPIRFPVAADGIGVDKVRLEKFSDDLHRFLSYAFGHVCMTTPFDDFVYILSVEKDERDTETGYLPFVMTLRCHITAFIWAFEDLASWFLEGRVERPSSRLKSLPGDQVLDVHPRLEQCVAHRICRTGATRISIQELENRPIPLDGPATTSTLLRILSVVVKSQLLVWDNADSSPDWEKVVSMLAHLRCERLQLGRISDRTVES